MKKVLHWLDKHLEETILAILLAMLTCVMFTQICLRFFTGKTLIWPEEFARDCFIYTAFFCIPLCIKTNRMLKVDIIVGMFPEKLRKIVMYLGDWFGFFVWGYLWIYSFDVIKLYMNVTSVSQTMGFNMLVIYAMPAVALGLATIRGAQRLYLVGRDLFFGRKKAVSENTERTEGEEERR